MVKNGVTGTQSLGFGSRGSGLRCTTDAPLVQDPSNSATLYLGCNGLFRSTNRGANWTTIAAPDALTGPAPADDGPNNNPLYAGQFPTISTIAPSKSDPNTIYVGTDNGRLPIPPTPRTRLPRTAAILGIVPRDNLRRACR